MKPHNENKNFTNHFCSFSYRGGSRVRLWCDCITAEVSSTFEHFDCATYSVQACHSSSKFRSVRQISNIHRIAQRHNTEKTNKRKKKKHVPHYYLVTWETQDTSFFLSVFSWWHHFQLRKLNLNNPVIQPGHIKPTSRRHRLNWTIL